MDRESQGAGERTQAHCYYEDQCPENIRDRAENVEYEAREAVGDGPEEAFDPRCADRSSFPGCEGGEREGRNCSDESAQKRHLEGFEEADSRRTERGCREVGRKHPGDKLLDGTGAGEELEEGGRGGRR